MLIWGKSFHSFGFLQCNSPPFIFDNKIKQEYYKKYKATPDRPITGLMMLPKKIADEYLIAKEVKPYDVKHNFTPKK